jgi:hypothetical protein
VDETAHYPPHATHIQDILNRAGMSKSSELTADEYAGALEAHEEFGDVPHVNSRRIYLMIRKSAMPEEVPS